MPIINDQYHHSLDGGLDIYFDDHQPYPSSIDSNHFGVYKKLYRPCKSFREELKLALEQLINLPLKGQPVLKFSGGYDSQAGLISLLELKADFKLLVYEKHDQHGNLANKAELEEATSQLKHRGLQYELLKPNLYEMIEKYKIVKEKLFSAFDTFRYAFFNVPDHHKDDLMINIAGDYFHYSGTKYGDPLVEPLVPFHHLDQAAFLELGFNTVANVYQLTRPLFFSHIFNPVYLQLRKIELESGIYSETMRQIKSYGGSLRHLSMTDHLFKPLFFDNEYGDEIKHVSKSHGLETLDLSLPPFNQINQELAGRWTTKISFEDLWKLYQGEVEEIKISGW